MREGSSGPCGDDSGEDIGITIAGLAAALGEVHALLHRVEDALDLTVPLGDLPEQALAWENGVDELAREDGEIADYIASLERREDETALPEASGEAIAKAFERYLRRRDGDA